MLECNLYVRAAQRNIGVAIVNMSLRSASRLLASCTRLRAWQIGQCLALQHASVSEQPTTLASAQPSWLESKRGLHFSAALLAVEDVVVPSMGDSITEGGNTAALRMKRTCLSGLYDERHCVCNLSIDVCISSPAIAPFMPTHRRRLFQT